MSTTEQRMKSALGLKPDFPVFTLAGFLTSLIGIIPLWPHVARYVPSPYYSITVNGDDFIIFTERAIWILILITFVTFLTLAFIIPLALYFRGLSEWEWDPTLVVFWLLITKGSSLFFIEIAKTNSNLEEYTIILIDIVDSIFILFMTVFLLRAYSNFFVPVISDWLNVGKSDTQYGPILDIIGSILIVTFGVTNFLSTYHVDFGVLLAGVGVVGLVIALAAQDTLSNFFSGILLLLDQGFKTGDMIYFNETYCLIREIGLRSTKIYDIINHVIIIIPNNSLANQEILNLTRPDRYYRLRTEVGVSYDSDPDLVEKLLLEVAEENGEIEHDDPTRRPLVRFREFGDSALTFSLVAWIKNVIKIRQINSDLHHQIFKKLGDANVVIAFPQRDIHVHDVTKSSKKYITKPVEDSDPEKKAREEAEEKARQAEKELKQAEESARQAEEEKAKLEVEEAERQVEESAKEAEEAAKKAEEEKSKKAEQEAKKAEEAARKAEEAKAKLEIEEVAKKAEEEKARFEAEEAIRLADEKKARIEAEKTAKIAEEKKAKIQAEEAETRKLIEEIKARQSAEKK